MRKKRPEIAPKKEASLAEILADPITHALMRADGIVAADVRAIVDDLRRSLGIAARSDPPREDMFGPRRPRLRLTRASDAPALRRRSA